MAEFAGLTAPQQDTIAAFVDRVFRPDVLGMVGSLAGAANQVLPAWLASPSGSASTWASPAADSIAGILAGLTPTDVIPIAAGSNATGLALAQPLVVGVVLANLAILETLVSTYWTAANQQMFANIVGAPNV